MSARGGERSAAAFEALALSPPAVDVAAAQGIASADWEALPPDVQHAVVAKVLECVLLDILGTRARALPT